MLYKFLGILVWNGAEASCARSTGGPTARAARGRGRGGRCGRRRARSSHSDCADSPVVRGRFDVRGSRRASGPSRRGDGIGPCRPILDGLALEAVDGCPPAPTPASCACAGAVPAAPRPEGCRCCARGGRRRSRGRVAARRAGARDRVWRARTWCRRRSRRAGPVAGVGERRALALPAPRVGPARGAASSSRGADEPGGEVIDRAVLAERRARRAEAAEQAQARVASEALRALDALELRGTELELRSRPCPASATRWPSERGRWSGGRRATSTSGCAGGRPGGRGDGPAPGA